MHAWPSYKPGLKPSQSQLSLFACTKMTTPILSLSFLLLLATCTVAWPQDIGTGMMLAVGQLQQLAETGGGLQHELSGEVLGQQISGGLNLGMGEAMSQLPMGRRRRSNGRIHK